MTKTDLKVLVEIDCIIGEGPIYDNEVLFWVDLLDDCIYKYDFKSNEVNKLELGQNPGAIAFKENGRLIGALQNGFYNIDFDKKIVELIKNPEDDKPNNRFNDGKCDPAGRFWAGTMSKELDSGYGDYTPKGKLYCINHNYDIDLKIDEVIISNGIDWSPDFKTLYFIDTPRQNVVAWDYSLDDGSIRNPREVISLKSEKGMPDGMCIDKEGKLWIAMWGGSSVTRWDPVKGTLIDRIELPVLNVTSCTFGGKDYNDLFITTASTGTDKNKYPLAGSVFVCTPTIGGGPTNKFKE
jgi:sugar lactone lactonase YvrE